ncbi:gliding motility-associated C-terminal domain-containing protein [Filimonas lacunae]|uniref:Gliding motility-associated C-terminal domain-containing protein n=1 Tax=Filimonas lacunae TaxID=477680 RepID=A0A173MBP0_9BACT|nr:PKD domain-containing protein [Filimonas lacunae]BAV04946.1 hypothetical protein FLA_0951 [Filimonas lacunae]SIT33746.1 gliding motility-associated C-terminal domain-containing protein [Filimonas lacunae]
MKRYLKILSIACAWLVNSGHAQDLSNRGKDFWVGYGHHQFMEPGQDDSQEMVLYFSAEEEANVTVSINGTSWTRSYHIPANRVIASEYMPKNSSIYDCRLFTLPPSYGGTGSEGIFERGINIHSDVPIVAYAHTFGKKSSGATMLLPVETWGYSYVAINSGQVYQNNCFSWLYVVAQHNDTRIEIVPSVATRSGYAAGQVVQVTLQKGEIYQMVGANPSNGLSALELTGTTIRSVANASGECYPVAAFAGSSRTSNPFSCGKGGGDNDNQQLFPIRAWGKKYFTAPTSRSTAASYFMTNAYKVLVNDVNTVVKRNGKVLTGISNRCYYFESNTADIIEADRPVMVAQFMTGGTACMGAGVGDPEMIYISPVEQGINNIGFFRNNREGILFNYLTLIVPDRGTGLSSLTIDGVALSSLPAANRYTYKHPQSADYSVVVYRWTGFAAYPADAPGQCLVQSDSAFTAITYGLGSEESYGYNAGTNINSLNAYGYIHNQADSSVKSHAFTCAGTPVEVSVMLPYQPSSIYWKLSALSAVLTPSADVTQTNPVYQELTAVKAGTYYRYRLPGVYSFSATGTYVLPVTCYSSEIDRCDGSENFEVTIVVKEKPEAAFEIAQPTPCATDTLYMQGEEVEQHAYTIKQWMWTFNDTALTKGIAVKKVLNKAGSHTIRLSIVTADGCVADADKNVTTIAAPEIAYTYTGKLCEGRNVAIAAEAATGAEEVTAWNWNMGDGHLFVRNDASSFEYAYDQYGTYHATVTAVNADGCKSVPVTHILEVQPVPEVKFALPDTVCLPGGKALFTNKTTIADNSALSYQWSFGDGTPVSTEVNATHLYVAAGSYPVELTATSAYGCSTAYTQLLNRFNHRPVVAFSVQPEQLCQGMPVVFRDASTVEGDVINQRQWSLGDGSTASGGEVSLVYRNAGDYTAMLQVTSSKGCRSFPGSKGVVVYRQPVIEAGNDIMAKTGAAVKLAAVSSAGAYTFQWYPSIGLSSTTELQPSVTVTDDITYYLTATGEFNCTATDSVHIKLLRAIEPPNAFSPNGDGVHDVWEIPYLDATPGARITVFNRYGQQVYTSQGYAVPWNGTSAGKPLPAGTYYYVIQTGSEKGPLTGAVTIIK